MKTPYWLVIVSLLSASITGSIGGYLSNQVLKQQNQSSTDLHEKQLKLREYELILKYQPQHKHTISIVKYSSDMSDVKALGYDKLVTELMKVYYKQHDFRDFRDKQYHDITSKYSFRQLEHAFMLYGDDFFRLQGEELETALKLCANSDL